MRFSYSSSCPRGIQIGTVELTSSITAFASPSKTNHEIVTLYRATLLFLKQEFQQFLGRPRAKTSPLRITYYYFNSCIFQFNMEGCIIVELKNPLSWLFHVTSLIIQLIVFLQLEIIVWACLYSSIFASSRNCLGFEDKIISSMSKLSKNNSNLFNFFSS